MNFLDLFKPRARSHGWLKEEPDARDMRIGSLTLDPSIPAAASLRHPAITVRDQDGTQSCVGFAWAQALELAYAWHNVLTGDLSPLALYFWARASHGSAGEDAGTYLRAAAKAVMRFGVPIEKTCPFSARRVNVSPPWMAYRDAYDRRGLRGYYRVDANDLDGIRRAIANGKPICGGWRVDRAFTQFRGTGSIDMITGEIIGGHAICLMGYGADGTFDLINSWGTGWGNAGYARVTEDFVSQGQDLWVLDVTP